MLRPGRPRFRIRRYRPEISRDQGQRCASARHLRRSDRGLDGAGAYAGSAAGPRAVSRAGRQKRRGPRGPDRLDLSRPEQRRDRAGRRFAGHGRRDLHRSGTASRGRRRDTSAGDYLLLPDGGRSGAGRASLSRPSDGARAGLRRLGAEGARALRARASPDALHAFQACLRIAPSATRRGSKCRSAP